MANIIDYVKWRGDITFDVDPFNFIDSLILSEISYIPFENILDDNIQGETISELGKKFLEKVDKDFKIGLILPEKELKEIFKLASISKRFKNIILKNYVSKISKDEEKQFCGITFLIDKKVTCIAYRGTDDTIVGWKEDFNMSFNTPIPAQKEAVEYLNKYGIKAKKLYVCGHSKGGNLASYAALFADENVKDKIIEVHSFDGPGFRSDFIDKITDEDIKNKTIKFLPQASVIGMIFDPIGKCVFLKSAAKGFYQHDAFNWQVLGNKFITVPKLDKSSTDAHDLINNWTKSMSNEERSEFVEALFKLITVNETATLTDIASDKFKFILGVLKSDGKTKKVFLSAINRLIKEKYFIKPKNKKKSTNDESHD